MTTFLLAKPAFVQKCIRAFDVGMYLRKSCCVVVLLLVQSSATAEWMENFDSYPDDAILHNLGGWRGWDGNPLDGGLISSTYARSGLHSVMVTYDSDVVHTFTRYTQGKWRLTAYLYVPTSMTGTSSFNLESRYIENTAHEPAVQVALSGLNNSFRPDWPDVQVFDPAPTLVRDHWVPIEFFIDLDNDYQESHYNGQLTSDGRWSGNFGNIVSFEAIDLYGYFATQNGPVYYDDFSLVAMQDPSTLLGDYNHNGVVDAADYVVWRKNLGAQTSFDAWRAHFGAGGGSSAGASANVAVPEPTTLVLVLAGTLTLLSRRRDTVS